MLMSGKDLADCHGKIILLEGLARPLCAVELPVLYECEFVDTLLTALLQLLSQRVRLLQAFGLQPENFVQRLRGWM